MTKPKITSIFMLAMINVAAMCNIANLPLTATYGFSSLFYYLLGAILFFIPLALVSAELATGWPQTGGVYIWVREALGEKYGFLAIWLQWVENVIWYPTILSFMAITIAYIFNPDLVQNKAYIITTTLVIFWGVTFLNFFGIKISGWISTLCVVGGTIFPMLLFIGLGSFWLFLGHPSQIEFSWKTFVPPMNEFKYYSLFAGLLFAFSGLEMSAVHAREVEHPQKNYPKAILLSTIMIFFLISFSALSMAVVLPVSKIAFGTGPIAALSSFLSVFNLNWALPIIACCIAFGSFGMVSTWIIGPSKGIYATAHNGELPPFLQKTNKRSVPVVILICQALIVTVLSFAFFLMPTISSSYALLLFLTAQLYLVMYVLMFLSAIILRYKYKDVPRAFKVPFGNIGMWIVASSGILISIFALITGFIPPSDLKQDHEKMTYVIFLLVGVLVFCAIPIIIHKCRKPSWHLSEKKEL
ncbi:MAG: amino acid permease [Chlamydiota bacterium]